ncbi:uncharacterized protein EI97DRAFT_456056 [Westerdykella ornata]|uniref:Uncharacterized protein n=1 Tax=Westerdykella ornata TaxID=318751 RepID=A0A6A6JU75_WESOR|nr:uncharacterized protein EI97DRAFT_456056 [Westerdykella ornata]KAF2278589.1 hypothetical protein EI97DRAFT_456056 [Westerdykella ornata]
MNTSFSILLLTLLSTLTLAAPEIRVDNPFAPGPTLTPRQAQAPISEVSCLDYSRIANLSVVGSNSSYRSAFYHRSLSGTMQDGAMFKAAQLALPAMTVDKGLNDRCGNLTTVALVEAERNLTRSVVLQFDNIVPITIKAGPEVAVITDAITN